MKLTIHTFQLRLKHTFSISHESRDVMPSLVVELSQDGHSGYGEATETRYYGILLDEMVQTLERLRPLIEATPLHTPEQFWETLQPRLAQHPFILCALDEAAHDLHGKLHSQPVYARWGLTLDHLPLSNFTIGIASIEEMVAKMEEQPWPLYKIKLGTDHDIEIVEALRQHTDATFRIDANTAWTAEQAIAYAPRLKELGVEFLEQPLKADDWEGMKRVYAECALPVIADEACHVEADVARCYGFYHGINIKLMKCGGLTPAKRMVDHARRLGIKVMVGCMTESSIGISAIAQLTPLLDYVDMDGAMLLSNDPATGVRLNDAGYPVFPGVNGTGAGLPR